MFRAPSISLLLALLALVFCCEAKAATEPSPWLEIHSTHFTVITDAGVKKGQEVALRFEQMRASFATVLTRDRLNQSIPLTIFAFDNDKSYYQLAPLHNGQPIEVPGFLLAGEDQDFIALNLGEQDSWRAVSRDFALMLLNYNYPPAQEWFDAGLTEYFSSIRLDNRQGEIGGDPGGTQKSFAELLKAQDWIPLPDLFSTKHVVTVGNQAGSQDPRSALYIAESWIVMHYLLHEKKLPETGAYFGLVLNQHLPVEDAIKQAFGVSSAQLEQAVKDYFHSSPQAEHFIAPVGPEDSAITSKPMLESDARALYAGVQVRIPERRELGLKALNQLSTTLTEADKKEEAKAAHKRVGEDQEQIPSGAQGDQIAHRMLAWDHIQHGEFEQAFNELNDAASLNPHDEWVRYYGSVAKYRMAQAKKTEMMGLANMMIDLKSVLEWNPEMASAYDLLAVARNAGGTTTAALDAQRAAIRLSPRNESYSFHLAQIYVTSKKWEAADALLERLKTSDNPQIVAQARDLQTQAGTQRKYGIAGSTAPSAQPKFEAQKSPFDVLEEEAAKRAAAEKSPSGTTADKRVTKFIKGRLVAVDCSQAPSAVLTVSSEAGTLKLRAADYKSLLLIGADDFSCSWRDRQVVANYKPSSGNGGDLVSLEMR
jgi:tetratricopeptide (TPR) repeat protein